MQSLVRITFTLEIKNASKEPIEVQTPCQLIYDAVAVHVIAERVRHAFFRTPFDGYVAWSVQDPNAKTLSEEVSMLSIRTARLTLEKFCSTLKQQLIARGSEVPDFDDADTIECEVPPALLAGGE
jgi:hypothetical protein